MKKQRSRFIAAMLAAVMCISCFADVSSYASVPETADTGTETSVPLSSEDPDDEAMEEETQAETDVQETESVPETEKQKEEKNAPETEEQKEEETAQKTGQKDPGFTFPEVKDKNVLTGLDFSSKRLLVAADDKIIADRDNIMSEYDGMYLLGYSSEDEAKKAYAYYIDKADMAAPDIEFAMADGTVSSVRTDITENANPLTELKEAIEDEGQVKGRNVIALIDTGVSKTSETVGRVSMLGDDPYDDNGHGTEMASAIASVSDGVQILSIKALDRNGKGTASTVYAAIEYAISQDVKVINLSMSAYSKAENAVVKDAIEEAVRNGIIVVGAAGNKGKNAKYFVPGNVEDAVIAGACDKDGNRLSSSNYGSTVDCYVEAGSTSEAAVKLSAWLAANSSFKTYKEDIKDITGTGMIFAPGQDTDISSEDIDTSDKDSAFEAAASTKVEATGRSSVIGKHKVSTFEVSYGSSGNTTYTGVCGHINVPNKLYEDGGKGATGTFTLAERAKISGSYIETTAGKKETTASKVHSTIEYKYAKLIYNIYINETKDSDGKTFYDDFKENLSDSKENGTKKEFELYFIQAGGSYLLGTIDDKDETLYSIKNDDYDYDVDVAGDSSKKGVGEQAWNWVKKNGIELPDNYTMYIIWSAPSNLKTMQPVVAWNDYTKPIYIKKTATGNKLPSGASVEGAVYNFYNRETRSDGTYEYTSFGSVTISGNGNSTELPSSMFTNNKTFYVKETKTPTNTPEGYHWILDSVYHPYKWDMSEGKGMTIELSDPLEENPHITLSKAVADGYSSLVSGNSLYSLAGATYGVYSDSDCKQLVETLTTDSNGNATSSKSYTIGSTVYVKEIRASQGYKIDTNKYPLNIRENTSDNKISSKEEPVVKPFKFYKVSPIGNADLSWAVFRMDYYTKYDPSSSDVPSRTWYFRVDKDGLCEYSSAYLLDSYYGVKSSSLFTLADGKTNSIPAGSIRLTEVTAPLNHVLNAISYVGDFKLSFDSSSNSYYIGNPEWVSDEKPETLPSGMYGIENTPIIIQTTAQSPDTGTDEVSLYVQNENGAKTYNTINITDTVSYENLPEGRYIVEGTLVDKSTGKALAVPETDGGNSKTFTSYSVISSDHYAKGSAEVTFTITPDEIRGFELDDGSNYLEDADLVVFERLYLVNDKDQDDASVLEKAQEYVSDTSLTTLRALHEDLDDEGQTIRVPGGRTHAVDGTDERFETDEHNNDETGRHEALASEEMYIQDRVTYENLHGGTDYTVTGTLHYSDGSEVLDDDGNPITQTEGFTTEGSYEDHVSGYVDITFGPFKGLKIAGEDIIAFEEVTHKDKPVPVFIHADVTDDWQTVHVPKISTVARVKDIDESLHEAPASGKTSITDTVSYENLKPGTEYTLKGSLVYREDYADEGIKAGDPVVQDGKAVTSEKTFETPGEKPEGSKYDGVSGSTALDFDVDLKALAGKSVTVYESLYTADSKDTAVDTESETAAQSETQETSDQQTGSESQTVTEDPDTDDDTDNTIPAAKLVAQHSDLADDGQSINIPDIGTTALDQKSGTHYQQAGKDNAVTDTVGLKNLQVGKKYKVSGTLMNKKTGKALVIDGKEITASLEFSYEDIKDNGTVTLSENGKYFSGSVVITFPVDSSALAGTTVVAFEDVTHDGIEVAFHKDIEDNDQSVDIVGIHTTATDSITGTHEGESSKKETVNDKVTLTGLSKDLTYKLVGTLMNKKTGKAVKYNGKDVIISKEFNYADVKDAEGTKLYEDGIHYDGTVELAFDADTLKLAGNTLVVFEKLYYGDTEIAAHEDLNDKDQSVNIVKIRTTAADKKSGSHKMTISGKAGLTDTVKYEGLTAGKKYILVGTVMDKETGKALKQNGKTVTVTSKFEAKKKGKKSGDVINGETTLTFNLNTEKLYGKSLVVYEKLYDADNVNIASHEDLNDKDQSVTVPEKPSKETPGTSSGGSGGSDSPKAVKTGDIFNPMLWAVILCGSGAAMFFMIRRRKKSHKKTSE